MSSVSSSEEKSEMSVVKLSKLWRKRFICQLRQQIGARFILTEMTLTGVLTLVATLEENIQSAFFKLKSITEIFSIGDADEHEQLSKLCYENSEQTYKILFICNKFLKTSDSETQSEVTNNASDQRYKSVLSKTRKPSLKCSSKSSGSKTFQKSQRLAIQKENWAERESRGNWKIQQNCRELWNDPTTREEPYESNCMVKDWYLKLMILK